MYGQEIITLISRSCFTDLEQGWIHEKRKKNLFTGVQLSLTKKAQIKSGVSLKLIF